MEKSRRSFLKKAGSVSAGILASPILNALPDQNVLKANQTISNLDPKQAASNEEYWKTIKESFSVPEDPLNLNNAGTCPQPIVVQEALKKHLDFASQGPSYFMYRKQVKEVENIRNSLANLAGADPEEITVQLNTTTALETVIFGLPFANGDEILTTTQDYSSIRNCLAQRQKRDGIVVKEIKLPLPLPRIEDAVAIFEQACSSKTKAIVLSHMINLTGQMLPVKEICDMAHSKGIEVIVDAAQTFAQMVHTIPELNCDYYGASLHKWLYAPLGTGLLYVKKEKIEKVWPLLADDVYSDDNIRKFEHLGTRSFPAQLTIPTAVEFHNTIGGKRKEERLRHLTNYWLTQALEIPGTELLTSPETNQLGALATIRFKDKDIIPLVDKLLKDYRIFVTYVNHEEFKGMRISPSVHNTEEDLDKFIDALKKTIKALWG